MKSGVEKRADTNNKMPFNANLVFVLIKCKTHETDAINSMLLSYCNRHPVIIIRIQKWPMRIKEANTNEQ